MENLWFPVGFTLSQPIGRKAKATMEATPTAPEATPEAAAEAFLGHMPTRSDLLHAKIAMI